MDRNRLALEKLYSNLRLTCYQFPSFLSDIENDYYVKTESDQKILKSIKDSLKSCIDNSFDSANLLYSILNNENEFNEGS
jgi:hypothetical protein